MKKVILVILALILAIALVIAGYMLIGFRGLQKYSRADAPCPYSWQELRDGTIRLEIDTAAYPDYGWAAECYPQNVVAVAGVESEPGTVAFSILPLNMGQTYVQVFCEQTETFAVRVFEISMQISVSEEGEISVEKTGHKDYGGIAELGKADGTARYWVGPDGTANLLIAETGDGWEAVNYDPESLEVSGPFYREGSCGFEIQGKLAGTFPLTIYSGESKAFLLEVEVAEDLTATITGFAEGVYAPDRSGEHTALETVAGSTINLPPQAVAVDYSVKRASGSVDFLLNDAQWCWQISTEETAEELVKDFATNAAETATADEHDVTLSAYRFSDGVVASWSDGTRAMALYGERETALRDLLAVAGQIVEANNG